MKLFKNIVLALSLFANFLVLFYHFHFVWATKYRAELNHGLDFPETTKVLSCEGALIFRDSYARSQVQIHPIQLNKFLSQLEIMNKSVDTLDGVGQTLLNCKAPKGDYLTIRYAISESGYCNITIDSNRD